MDKAHVHYCWRARGGGGGREDLWSALCLLWRSAPTRKDQEHGILSPGPSPTPPTSLPGCSLKTCCPKPREERPPKRSWVASHLKGDKVGRCSRMRCSPQGQRWGRNAEWWGRPWGPTTPHLRGADVPQQAQHRDCTHCLQTEARTMHTREQGVTGLKPLFHTKGYKSQGWAGSPYMFPFKSREPLGSSSQLPPMWCLDMNSCNSSSPKEEVGDGRGNKAFSFTLLCKTNMWAFACASINERHKDIRPPASTSVVHPPIPQFPGKWRTMTESKKSKSFGAALQLATAPVR